MSGAGGGPPAPAPSAAVPSPTYDGQPVAALGAHLGVPALHAYATAGSTMDLAHALAAGGAPAGTTVVADVQTGGRGRNGRRWASEVGAGVWATVLERPQDLAAVGVLSLRVGLALAEGLEAVAGGSLQLKWPNDVLREGRKVAGILVEARWREAVPDWVAVGVGVNLRPPGDVPTSIGLGVDVGRAEVLGAVVTAIRTVSRATGPLTRAELARYARRDAGTGRPVVAPVSGIAQGLTPEGALRVATSDGRTENLASAAVQWADELGERWRVLPP